MAPTRSSVHQQSLLQSSPDLGSTRSDGDDTSQMDLILMAEKVIKSNRGRRERKRQGVAKEYKKNLAALNARLTSQFETRQKQMDVAQNAQWDQLIELLNRRATLEARIMSHIKTVEEATINISSQFQAVIAGRLDDIAKLK